MDYIQNTQISNDRMVKAVNNNYEQLLGENLRLCRQIYQFLHLLADGIPENQLEIYNHRHCFMKHLSYLDESIILTNTIIRDNIVVLKLLTENFFGSLGLLQDILKKQDPKENLKIDLSIVDPNQDLYAG